MIIPSRPSSTDLDTRMMAIALAMAERGLGRTAPNPAVGAVIVDETTGEVIARGWTQPGGRPHAETEAIARAGERARGATIYVTLEPCSHHGKTPPCAGAIIAAGIRRVVCSVLDPDPRVSGRGLRMLRDAGLEVVRGVLAERGHRVTRGHILRVTERRPLVQLKMALGPDGRIARGSRGQPVWVTGPEARAHGHLLRAKADAILVGSQTVIDDDPDLTCRLPGMAERSPIRVVLAGRTLPSPAAKLVTSARRVPTLVVTSADSDADDRAALTSRGCRLIDVVGLDGRPWLPAVMEALVQEGITRLLVEGGPTMWTQFLAANLADEVHAYRAGAAGSLSPADAAGAMPFSPLIGNPRFFTLAESRDVGADRLYVYYRS